ncbi:hypothetical protein SAMN03080615_00065 [Amphritea atlantica]|uniref:Uncharacterized protein n=1 Tax=Amphritea atlantica TaxID=355243 RepID=A0A1H9CMU6_9GAMM|nr:hypothetical protein [Amphritea atlantica]SEQ02489.1 hypothetical protein SAMN03080615_00065 [Amphritea atlantica]
MKLTEILAIYAALLSTIVFFWNVVRTVPRYKVDIGFGIESENDQPKHGVYISTKNPSPHTVHLANIDILYRHSEESFFERVKFLFKYKRLPISVGWVYSSLSLYKIDDKCPISLESGKSHMVFVPNETLEEILEGSCSRDLRACVSDQLWRRKYSNVFVYPKDGISRN